MTIGQSYSLTLPIAVASDVDSCKVPTYEIVAGSVSSVNNGPFINTSQQTFTQTLDTTGISSATTSLVLHAIIDSATVV